MLVLLQYYNYSNFLGSLMCVAAEFIVDDEYDFCELYEYDFCELVCVNETLCPRGTRAVRLTCKLK